MKDLIIKIVEEKLAVAEDNLYLANMQFSNADLGRKHGQSGKSCGEIWQGYEDEVQELKKAQEWIHSVNTEASR